MKTKTLHLDATGELKFTNSTFNVRVDTKTLSESLSVDRRKEMLFKTILSWKRENVFSLGLCSPLHCNNVNSWETMGKECLNVSVQEIWLVMLSTVIMYTAHCFFQHGLLQFYLFIFTKQNHLLSLFLF